MNIIFRWVGSTTNIKLMGISTIHYFSSLEDEPILAIHVLWVESTT